MNRILLITCVTAQLAAGSALAQPDYLEPDNDRIKIELGVDGGFAELSDDGTNPFQPSEEYSFNDRLYAGGLYFRWYSSPRYEHPDVPFGFVPYNFRTSYTTYQLFYSQEKIESPSWPYSYTMTRDWKNYGFDIYEEKYHTSGFFAVSNIRAEGLESYGSDASRFSISVLGGGSNRHMRGGIGLGIQNTADNLFEALWASDKNFTIISLIGLLEITPSGYVRIAVSPDINWQEKGFHPSPYYNLPLRVSAMLAPNWIEMNFGWTISDGEDSFAAHALSLQLRKYFATHSFWGETRMIHSGYDRKSRLVYFGGGFELNTPHSDVPLQLLVSAGYQEAHRVQVMIGDASGLEIQTAIRLFFRD